jgi:DNA helicase II / ATP-dependent DNA helicase PcrA
MAHNPDEFDSQKLIADFLAGFSRQDRIDKPTAFKSEHLSDLSPEDFDQPETNEGIQNRLTQLDQLIRSVEANSKIDYLEYYQKDAPTFKINYKASLNPAQYYAVTTLEGPLLVIAGAGSGKTRTAVYRVAYLLENKVDPTSILLLTFTRKAAAEMIGRTTELLGNQSASQIVAGTFHAFANATLRKYANFIGIPSRFTIIDTVDAEDVVSLIRDELILKRDKLFPKKNRIYEIISKSKNCRQSIAEILELEFSGLLPYLNDLELIAEAYEKFKEANFLFDYDDLLIVLANALTTNDTFRSKMQREFQYVLVDEYQDTNLYQRIIVTLLAEKHRRIMVVGDDSQSIYAFRGARFENILEFPLSFPEARVVKIEQNYRSNQGLLDFSNSIIRQARLAYQKQLFSELKNRQIPSFRKFFNQEDEAAWIVDKIIEYRENGIPQNQLAVLVRASFHSNFVQAELLKRSIPYVVVGGIKFTERRHIRDMIAFMRLLLNPFDASSWHRILKLLPGIGNAASKTIIQEIRKNEGKIDFVAFNQKKYYPVLEQMQLAFLKAGDQKVSVSGKIDAIREFYNPILSQIEDDLEKRNLDIDVLHTLASRYERIDQFLSDFALDPPSAQLQDSASPLITEGEDPPLVVSTIHSAKGLEWHAVFIPHLIDGLFPSSRALRSVEEMEEERRLFYVACTRAKEHLHLSMPSAFAAWDKVFTKPSRFLVEIEKHFINILR